MSVPSLRTCLGLARNRAAHTENALARRLRRWKTQEQRDAEPPRAVRACRVCGCTDTNACPCRCWWVDVDLCSACQGSVEESR